MKVVNLTARGFQRFRTGHPWVYRSDIIDLPELAGFYPVAGPRGWVLGWAAINPNSEISARIITRGDVEPTTELLQKRLLKAFEFRQRLNIESDSYRLVHGEADGLPGLVIDRYKDVLVIQNGSAVLESKLNSFLEVILEHLRPSGVLARFDTRTRLFEGLEQEVFVAHGQVPEAIEINQDNLKFVVDLWNGQKTGAFLDQRENRALLARFARGRGLDAFCYQGGFAMHLARSCDSVECLDSSEPALTIAKKNAALNHFHNVQFIEANVFDTLRNKDKNGEQYDVINLDPPALAKARRDLEAAYRAYKELNLRAMKLLKPGGILGTSSCSFHMSEGEFYSMLWDAAADAGRQMRVLLRKGASSDHPELLNVPESRYLKFAILEVMEF